MEDISIAQKSGALNQEDKELVNDKGALNQKKEERKGVNIALNQEDKELVNDKGALNQKLNETEQQTKKLVDQARSLMDTGSNEFVTRELNQIQSDPTVSPIAQDLIKR